MYEFLKAFELVTLFYKTKLFCLQIEIILLSISGPSLSFGRTFLSNVYWLSLYSMPGAEPEARSRESSRSWPVRSQSSGSGEEKDSETAHWCHGTTTLLDVQRVTGAAGSPVLLTQEGKGKGHLQKCAHPPRRQKRQLLMYWHYIHRFLAVNFKFFFRKGYIVSPITSVCCPMKECKCSF